MSASLDAKYWDTRYDSLDTPWDMGEASPSVVELAKKLAIPPRSHIVVPGCGRGHDALHFARQDHRVSAIDWSEPAMQDLRNIARRENLEIETLNIDLWEIPESWHGTFDYWVEHTFFAAIPPENRELYIDQALKLLKPSGQIMGAYFVDWEFEKTPPYAIQQADFKSLFEPHFEIQLLEKSPVAHPGRAGKEWWAHLTRR